MTEIWKDIKGYEGLYQVSNFGRIKNVQRMVNDWKGKRTIKEKIISLEQKKNGYLRVNLWKENKYKRFYVHRLVAQAFLTNINDYPCVDHINGCRNDNTLSNLRWVSYKQNAQYAKERKKLHEQRGELWGG